MGRSEWELFPTILYFMSYSILTTVHKDILVCE